MKRTICLFLVAALLLSFLPGLALQASAVTYIEDVFVSPGNYRIGDPIPEADEIPVYAEGGTVRSVSGFTNEADGQPATGVFEKNKKYYLTLELEAPEGFIYPEAAWYDCPSMVSYTILENGTVLQMKFQYDFSYKLISGIFLGNLPREIQPGPAEIPSPKWYSATGDVTGTRWLDSNKQPVDTLEFGKSYYLEVTVTTRCNAYYSYIEMQGKDEYTLDDACQVMTYYKYYTLLPVAERLQVTTSGIGEGLPISGISAQITGEAVLDKVSVYDETAKRTVTSGVFEKGKSYRIDFTLKPADGYRFTEDTVVLVDNGIDTSLSDDTITFRKTLVTMDIINTAKLSSSGIAVGKSIKSAKLTAPSNANYTITNTSWSTTGDTSKATFQKGCYYYLEFTLKAKSGYAFSTENLTATVDGKDVLQITSSNGSIATGIMAYSFMTEITKVSLPAMPKSVKQGATLSTNFKVSSSAKYTLETLWMSMTTGETVTKADGNDCYLLNYVVMPKDGYEFTDDTVFYVDGKKVEPLIYTGYYAQITKPYNVGLTQISRIDLTLPEPEHGAEPGEVTVAADAPYLPILQAWGVNDSGDPDDEGTEVTVFENYRYHFLGLELAATEGYCFADTVSVYINGNKYAVLEAINLGTAYQFAVSFGKLGEIAKLTAPELSKDGLTLCWHGVPNADGYEIYRATSKSGKYTKVATVQETSWQDTPVQGKSYYYKVKAIFTPDTSKNSGYSTVVSIAYTCDAPEITVENGATGKPVITWEKISGAKKYTVYRATSETGKYSKLGTTTKLTYTDSKAKTGTTYFYKVIANASSSSYNSGYSNIESCNVICSSVTVTVKVDAATGKPSLSWKKIDGATGYRILRQLPGEADFTVIKEQTAVTFTDTSAPIDTQCIYLVQVMGKTSALDSQMSKEISATSGIAKPVLKTSVDASGKPELRWQTVEGAVKYEIYRSTKSTKSYSLLTTVEGTTYVDEAVAPGKTYYYKVVAIGAVSKSAESSYAKLSGKCATPLLSVTINEDSGKPTLTWEKISGAKKYTIYRATSETGKYSKLGTTTKLTYTDNKATVGKTYYYKIVANASSSSYNSAYSNLESCLTICAKPVVKASTVTATGKPQLSWGKVTSAKEYWILLDVDGQPQLLTTTTKLSFIDEAAAPGETRTYAVWAVNADPVCNSAMDAYTVTATCAQPKIKGKVGETGKPEITWDTVEGATRYVIYRSTSKSKNYKAIDETTDLTFIDTTATKGKTYYYKVVAVCEDTESAQSAYAKVKSK